MVYRAEMRALEKAITELPVSEFQKSILLLQLESALLEREVEAVSWCNEMVGRLAQKGVSDEKQ